MTSILIAVASALVKFSIMSIMVSIFFTKIFQLCAFHVFLKVSSKFHQNLFTKVSSNICSKGLHLSLFKALTWVTFTPPKFPCELVIGPSARTSTPFLNLDNLYFGQLSFKVILGFLNLNDCLFF